MFYNRAQLDLFILMAAVKRVSVHCGLSYRVLVPDIFDYIVSNQSNNVNHTLLI